MGLDLELVFESSLGVSNRIASSRDFFLTKKNG